MNRQSGENRKVSQNAKPESLTCLKNPTSLNSPIERRKNNDAMTKVAQRKIQFGIVSPKKPICPKMVIIAANNAPATKMVAKGDGLKTGLLPTLGIVNELPKRPPIAQ